MTIADSLFGVLTETEGLEQVIRKRLPQIALTDIRREGTYEA